MSLTPKLTPTSMSPGGSNCVSPAGSSSGVSMGLSIECSSRMGSPRIQSLSLELLASPSARSVPLEESWKGEILTDFLYLGDRVTASDIDRLRSLQITHVLNATEDIANFFEAMTPRLSYHRCPIRDQSDAAAAMSAQFADCAAFLDGCRARGGRALVHCRAGVSRSATIVIGYLMHAERLDLKTALHHVRRPPLQCLPLRLARLVSSITAIVPVPLRHRPATPSSSPPISGSCLQVDSRRFVQPNSGFIDFLLSLERSLFGAAPPPP